jgi:sulfide:quinone oxidoreductase
MIMQIKKISPFLSVTPQLTANDIGVAAAQGFKTIICNRPDNEAEDQPARAELEAAAKRYEMSWYYLPVVPGQITGRDVEQFASTMAQAQGPVLAFCRTGTRSTTLWALSEAHHLDTDAILAAAQEAGYDLSNLRERLTLKAHEKAASAPNAKSNTGKHDVLIVGGGAGGQATAASLLKRSPNLNIAIIEPNTEHYYQPGWTLVGGGVFERKDTMRQMASVMPQNVKWYHTAASAFKPENQQVILENGDAIGYRILVVAPGLTLNWDAIPGLRETLGKNGVTSNYRFDLAPYTWELVQQLRGGKALFTQPPMPIKCAGAPQKAMYLSCDHWLKQKRINDIEVEFCTAGAALFGVADYVPALMEYVERYGVGLNYQTNLIKVDGPAHTAWFKVTDADGNTQEVEKTFDMLHVCPPQKAPEFIAQSPLADAAGWVDLNPETLQHKRYGNVFGLGDCGNTPNAKTAAAVRKQAPVVAENVLMALQGEVPRAIYDGYGSCPLTVERGKIVLAEFGYGGKLQPTFPSWLVEGKQPSRLSWFLKEKMLPWIYWEGMLKGHEWLAKPEILKHRPQEHEAADACNFGDQRKP